MHRHDLRAVRPILFGRQGQDGQGNGNGHAKHPKASTTLGDPLPSVEPLSSVEPSSGPGSPSTPSVSSTFSATQTSANPSVPTAVTVLSASSISLSPAATTDVSNNVIPDVPEPTSTESSETRTPAMNVGAVFGVVAGVFLALALLYFGFRCFARRRRELKQNEDFFDADLFRKQSTILDDKCHPEADNYSASARDSHSRPPTWYDGHTDHLVVASYRPSDGTDDFVPYDVFGRLPPSDPFNAGQATPLAVSTAQAPFSGQPPMSTTSPDTEYNPASPVVHHPLSHAQHSANFTPNPPDPAHPSIPRSPAPNSELPRHPSAAHWTPHLRPDRTPIQESPFADPHPRGYYDNDAGSMLGVVLYTASPDASRKAQAS